jgi:glycosyltransferase involved in cell wall biosynthesis
MTQPDPPAIAVILPVHNRAAAVRRAIDSVLAQDFEDFELIVVDDGSSDDTAIVVDSFRDPRLKFVRLAKNIGGNGARNRGLEAATAPLVTFLDSDDTYLPEKLAFTIDYFARRPDIDVLLDSFIKSYRPDRAVPDVPLPNPVIEGNDAVLEALFTRRIWKATPAITARRNVALAAGKFDEGLRRRQDFDFILRLAKVGTCATTDRLTWVKSFSLDAISAGQGNFVSSTLAFYERHPEYYDNPAYRPGFAHDLGRHFVRLLRKGKLGKAARDARTLARAIGPVKFLRLTIGGFGQFSGRRRRLRAAGAAASGGPRG